MSQRELEAFVRLWQRRLGLERWELKIEWDKPAGDDFAAQIFCSMSYDSARIRFESEWSKWTRDEAQKIVVHELLHALHRDVDTAVESIDGQIHRDAQTVFDRQYKHALEGMIERLALRIVEVAADV